MSANTITQGKVKLKHVTNKLLYIDLSSKWGGYFREEAENIRTNFLIVIFFFFGWLQLQNYCLVYDRSDCSDSDSPKHCALFM